MSICGFFDNHLCEAEDWLRFKQRCKLFSLSPIPAGYPMIAVQMKHLIEKELWKSAKVDLQYYQGWINPIIHDTENTNQNTWRLRPDKSGLNCCIGDIGTHAFDMLEYVTV